MCAHEAVSDKNTRNMTQGHGRVAGRAAGAGDNGGLQSKVGLRSRAASMDRENPLMRGEATTQGSWVLLALGR